VGLFRRRSEPDHHAGVVYVHEKRRPDHGRYYSAVCACGWFAAPIEATYPDPVIERRMAAAALEHDPFADTSVGFPLDEPERDA
jgi:hypothetical protein